MPRMLVGHGIASRFLCLRQVSDRSGELVVHCGNSDALLPTYRARRCWAKGSAESNKKEFQYSICHHKQGAGAMHAF